MISLLKSILAVSSPFFDLFVTWEWLVSGCALQSFLLFSVFSLLQIHLSFFFPSHQMFLLSYAGSQRWQGGLAIPLTSAFLGASHAAYGACLCLSHTPCYGAACVNLCSCDS